MINEIVLDLKKGQIIMNLCFYYRENLKRLFLFYFIYIQFSLVYYF